MLSSSQFFYYTRLFKFSFEFLQRFFNVFAFFYWYNNHVFNLFKYVVTNYFMAKMWRKITYTFFIYKTFRHIFLFWQILLLFPPSPPKLFMQAEIIFRLLQTVLSPCQK